MVPAVAMAIGTAGAGMLQGILDAEAEKRKLAWEKQKWADQQREQRFSQELSARNQMVAQPGREVQRETQTLQNLLANLRGTIRGG
jgi:hypothetical protein